MLRLACPIFLSLCAIPAHAIECRQALALGLDVSGSVDAREYRLQMDGLAQALAAPSVQSALLAQPQFPVRLLVYEWSGPTDLRLIAPWTTIKTKDDLSSVVQTLHTTQRAASGPGTALGHAMLAGATYLEQTSCWSKTLDISGDGTSNLGPRPRDVKSLLEGRQITINALAIGPVEAITDDIKKVPASDLAAYFRAEVIMGPDAFVETSVGFSQYTAAMTRKLEREIKMLQLSMR